MKHNLFHAIQLANVVHGGQVDKGGNPYILHPLWVMSRMTTPDQMILAVLHDTMEDGNADKVRDVMRFAGLSYLIKDLEVLTRKKDEDYFDYIDRIKGNKNATAVKLVDLQHNTDMDRLNKSFDEITLYEWKRHNKYLKAIAILEGD